MATGRLSSGCSAVGVASLGCVVGRGWLGRSRNGAADTSSPSPATWLIYAGVAALALAAFTIGFMLGGAVNYPEGNDTPANQPAPLKHDNRSLSGK